MRSKFEIIEDGEFLTFVISFFPPLPSTTFLPLPTPPIANPEPGPGSSIKTLDLRASSHIPYL